MLSIIERADLIQLANKGYKEHYDILFLLELRKKLSPMIDMYGAECILRFLRTYSGLTLRLYLELLFITSPNEKDCVTYKL